MCYTNNGPVISSLCYDFVQERLIFIFSYQYFYALCLPVEEVLMGRDLAPVPAHLLLQRLVRRLLALHQSGHGVLKLILCFLKLKQEEKYQSCLVFLIRHLWQLLLHEPAQEGLNAGVQVAAGELAGLRNKILSFLRIFCNSKKNPT